MFYSSQIAFFSSNSLLVVVFDIIYCNGVSIIEQPLSERIGILPKIIQEKKGYLEILPNTEASSVQDIIDELDKAVAARLVSNSHCLSMLFLRPSVMVVYIHMHHCFKARRYRGQEPFMHVCSWTEK